MRTVVLDAGALIALERRDGRMLALLRGLVTAQVAAHVLVGVVAQVWRALKSFELGPAIERQLFWANAERFFGTG